MTTKQKPKQPTTDIQIYAEDRKKLEDFKIHPNEFMRDVVSRKLKKMTEKEYVVTSIWCDNCKKYHTKKELEFIQVLTAKNQVLETRIFCKNSPHGSEANELAFREESK